MAWKSGHVQQPLWQGDGQSIHLASPLGPWILEVQQAKSGIKPHVPLPHITIVYTGNECSVILRCPLGVSVIQKQPGQMRHGVIVPLPSALNLYVLRQAQRDTVLATMALRDDRYRLRS